MGQHPAKNQPFGCAKISHFHRETPVVGLDGSMGQHMGYRGKKGFLTPKILNVTFETGRGSPLKKGLETPVFSSYGMAV